MLSKLKSIGKKVVSGVKSAFSGLGGNNLLASSISANKAQIQKNTATANPANNLTVKTYTPPGQQLATARAASTPLSGGQRPLTTSTYNGSAGPSIAYPTGGASPIYSTPTTLMGGQKADTLSFAPMSFDGGGSINSSSLSAPSTPISMPNAPSYGDVGNINNGGFNNDMTVVDPTTNMVMSAQQDEVAGADDKKRNDLMEKLTGMIPQKASLYEDPEIQAQREEVNRRKQEVANYSAQLNSVVAQQNADLLRLRGVGAAEGVTETVYGGQQATINREAAIKALPIQAQLSAAQGNLELAQDFLTQLSTFKKEQIDNDYNYRKEVYNSISEYVKGEDKRLLAQKEKQNDRQWQITQNNINLQDELMKEAIRSGQSGLISRINSVNPSSPNFRQEISRYASGLASANMGSGVVGADAPLYNGLKPATATAVRGVVGGFKSEPIVTNFTQVQEGRNFAQSIPNKTTNPADDQALIYSLAKALDPGSVVREGEYATAQKYAQSWVKAYGKKVTQAINGTGFLSEEARKNIKDTIETKYQASKRSYDNLYKQYGQQINSLTGRQDGTAFLRDYSTDSPITGGQTITAPDGTQVIIVD